MGGAGGRGGFADDVRRGLGSTPKRLDPTYLYDALGSRLFEAICELPWYPLTRAETALLSRHGARMVAGVGDGATLVELGCGSGEKLALLAAPLCARARGVRVELVDVSDTALELSTRTLARLGAQVTAHRATYDEGLARAAARRPRGPGAALVLFLGSSIGNLDPPAAEAFLRRIRAALCPGDGLLLGADLVKPVEELLLAYDDPVGVTAAFNKNLLARMNRELGADFDLRAFDHRAAWDPARSRVEMHLVSRGRQSVRIPAAGIDVELADGESIWTESSHKYSPDQIGGMAARAGFRCAHQWIEPTARFSTSLLAAI
ncbi:MAG: L-histidine N(alpha)-methyltransferase [Polyangiaceae bacterium]|nr:L-histidine N(alpha)-methyltransferase [Polyangiaceae bacterium]